MKEKKSGSISLANIIAILGLVLLLVCIWLGQALRNGELGGTSVLISVGVTLGAALLLWLMIKAKGAETSTTQWKIVEFSTLAVYLALAVLTAPLALNFFSVLSNKGKLQETAQKDLTNLNSTIQDFKNKENGYLGETCEGLKNVLKGKSSGILPKTDVITFIHEELSAEDFKSFDSNYIEEWKNGWEKDINHVNLIRLKNKDLDGVEPLEYGKVWDERLASCKNAILNWQLLKIPTAIGSIQSLSEDIGKTLTAFSKNAPFNSITFDSPYKLGTKKADEYETASEVQKTMKDLSPYTVIGIAAMVLIHLLILFNYLMAHRSHRREINQTEFDGGIIINI